MVILETMEIFQAHHQNPTVGAVRQTCQALVFLALLGNLILQLVHVVSVVVLCDIIPPIVKSP